MSSYGTHRYAVNLETNEPSVAVFSAIADTLTAETLAYAGFDIVVIDLQHGGASLYDLPDLVRAVELHGAAAFVRVPWTSPDDIMRAADAGVAAIIVPMVETVEQADIAARASRYPGRGNRSYGPARAERRATDRANEIVHVYPMIETPGALESVDEIMAIDGVDGVFVGPVDLGMSHGLQFEECFTHPLVVAGLDACIAAARREGKVVGTVGTGPDHSKELAARGVTWVGWGSDKAFVRSGADAAMTAWRS